MQRTLVDAVIEMKQGIEPLRQQATAAICIQEDLEETIEQLKSQLVRQLAGEEPPLVLRESMERGPSRNSTNADGMLEVLTYYSCLYRGALIHAESSAFLRATT